MRLFGFGLLVHLIAQTDGTERGRGSVYQSGDSGEDSAERRRCSARGSNQPLRRSSYNNCGDLPNTSACRGIQKRQTRSLILSAELSRIVRSTAEVPAFGVRRRVSWIMCGDTSSTPLTTLRISSQSDRVLISRGNRPAHFSVTQRADFFFDSGISARRWRSERGSVIVPTALSHRRWVGPSWHGTWINVSLMSDDNAEKGQEVRKGLSKEHHFFFFFFSLQSYSSAPLMESTRQTQHEDRMCTSLQTKKKNEITC